MKYYLTAARPEPLTHSMTHTVSTAIGTSQIVEGFLSDSGPRPETVKEIEI